MNPNNFKFWGVKGIENTIMAYVGPNKRIANILRAEDDIVEQKSITFNTVVTKIVPKLRKVLLDFKLIVRDDYSLQGQYLLAYKDKIFTIGNDGFVQEVNDFCALGSAERNGYGSLNTSNHTNLTSEERIIRAINSSYNNDYKISFPIIIGHTKSSDISITRRLIDYDFNYANDKNKDL
jgi:hypothetical protein